GTNVALGQSGSFSVPAADALLPVSIQPPHLANADAGSLPGELSVGSGAASYSVQLALPPGTAGMVPSLGLAYNSQGGNSAVGLGWSLTGLSKLHRCGLTLAQDGKAAAVGFTTDDRLCLDGQRLVLISGDSYWAANAVYRAEQDSFQRISRSGTGFKVELKSGLIHYYGGSTDSEAEGAGGDGQAHSWMLRRSQDRAGNLVDYQYGENATTGEHLPLAIRWGANGSLAHYARLAFEYESRPDAGPLYISGRRADLRQRLKRLLAYTDTAADGSGGTLASQYLFTYQTSISSGRSLLRTVQRCDGAGACLPATTFDWGQPDPAVPRAFVSLGTWTGPVLEDATAPLPWNNGEGGKLPLDMFFLGDFNGDGYPDLLEKYPTRGQSQKLFAGTGSGFTSSVAVFQNNLASFALLGSGDFDGDGLQDVVARPVDSFSPLRVCLSRYGRYGLNTFQCADWGIPGSFDNFVTRDLNADGRTDVLVTNVDTAKPSICLSQGNGFSCTTLAASQRFAQNEMLRASHETADLDGDGRVEEILAGVPSYDAEAERWNWINRGLTARFYDETGLKTGWGFSGYGGSDYMLQVPAAMAALSADINGDGYTDLAFGVGPAMTALEGRVCYSSGKSGLCSPLPDTGSREARGFKNDFMIEAVGNLDDDGRPDILATGPTTSQQRLCRVDGDNGYRCETWSAPVLPQPGSDAYEVDRSLIADLNGDGRLDIVIYRPGGKWEVYSPARLALPGQALDKLIRATNGLGQVGEVVYGLANDPSVYSRNALDRNGAAVTHAYPKQTQANSGQLAKALRVSNGQGDWLETRYSYAGAAADQQGRGHLGFARVDASNIDPDTAGVITTTTTWQSQDWPYTGMTTASRTTAANGVKLVDAVYTLDKQNPATGTVFPFVKQSTVVRLDLDGSGLDTTTTINTYGDGWGNLTQQDVTVSGGVTGGSKTYTAKTVTTYLNDATTWLIGRP
ncbi:FG-GAP-like repeat-containing protein, partial [Chitinimonas koreensis]